MAAQQHAIAKALFATSLLRPGVTTLGRDEISRFHDCLDKTVQQCSFKNIQTCKEWLRQNVVPSAPRTAALGKYLGALSRSHSNKTEAAAANEKSLRPSPQRASLNILYILHDLLHDCKHHGNDSSHFSDVRTSLQPFLVGVFQTASLGQRTRVRRRLEEILTIWEEESFYNKETLNNLHETIAGANNAKIQFSEGIKTTGNLEDDSVGKASKEAPYVMPATHGDPSTLCYDLPAGNLMPHIIPNSTLPIRPDAVRPLQFLAGPADETLVNAVKDFLHDVKRIDNPSMHQEEDEGMVVDVDSLGQRIVRLETGEIDLNGSDTYYGWSRAFCEKIKKRSRGNTDPERGRSYSSSSSLSPHKRRRFSDDSARSRSDSSDRSRSRRRPRYSSHDERRARRDYSPSPSRSRSYSPPSFVPLEQQEDPPRRPPQNQLAPPLPFGLPANGQVLPTFPMGPDGLPIPPPRPPGYTGPWPPPPPPLPHPNPSMTFPNASSSHPHATHLRP